MRKLNKEEIITEFIEAGIRITSYLAVMYIGKKIILEPISANAELKRNMANIESVLLDLSCDVIEKRIEELEKQ